TPSKFATPSAHWSMEVDPRSWIFCLSEPAMIVRWFNEMGRWRRYAAVTILSFPLALGIRAILQWILQEDVATGAAALVRQEKETPLSETLNRILTDTQFSDQPTQHHFLLGRLAPDFTLRDTEREMVTLRRLCHSGPVILVFYYGYQCS